VDILSSLSLAEEREREKMGIYIIRTAKDGSDEQSGLHSMYLVTHKMRL